MNTEIWKDVKNYEGLYQVSSYGRVRSLDRVVIDSEGRKHSLKGKIMKPAKGTGGYLVCSLCKNSKGKTFKAHRLVAEAFLPNPDNLPQVNHKDENKANNCVDNLEWCTRLYNMRYGTRIQRGAEKRLNSPKLSKSVLQIDLETNQIISEYPSTAEAARQLNINQGSISNCCLHRCKTYKGFKWQFKE